MSTGTPISFKGYDFLANDGAKIDRAVAIPSKDGDIYLAAKPGGLTGWTEIANSTFYYSTSTPTDMSIYKKQVTAGQRVELPLVSDFQGMTPIAKSITISVLPATKDARLSAIKIDGADVIQLTQSSGSEYNVIWRPDGKKIGFISEGQTEPKGQPFILL